ncbi:MAG: VOC family protein [Desulfobacterales bacterium]|nr:MAG: VOC family protein [Desulfobacterales bacterium]
MKIYSIIKKTNTILYCNQWKKTVAFYRHRLGLEIAFQGDWLVEFSLTQNAFLSIADQSRTTMTSGSGKGITLSFQIQNLLNAREELIKEGLTPAKIQSQIMGADVFYLFDPEGTRIKFWCYSQ